MAVSSLYIVLPHHLFREPPIPGEVETVLLLEEPLLFTQFRFHRGKLVYHRATMGHYAEYLRSLGYRVSYREARELEHEGALESALATALSAEDAAAGGASAPPAEAPSSPHGEDATIYLVDPTDDWLSQRLRNAAKAVGAGLIFLDSPGFLLSGEERSDYAAGKKRLFMADFYRTLRQSRGILMEGAEPVGGSYSFDQENRKKLPRGIATPALPAYPDGPVIEEARKSVDRDFPEAPGAWHQLAPTTHEEAQEALDQFIRERLERFGDYQDAVEPGEALLFHSLLSPALNAGLLTPKEVLERTLAYAEKREVPLNSLEGFLRQIVGWREFMLIAYEQLGARMRSRNFFGFSRPMPEAFYTGQTGLEPVDEIIRRVLKYGYAHHIERLMFLGNPMLLCEISPDEVYRWFMELFIDSYDWVMVPNVYGMSQFADGGLITTKPYVSSSNYIRKMSPWKKGNWARVWDALFWRFVYGQRELFEKNPRMSMMARQLEKMGDKKLNSHLTIGEGYLSALHEDGRPAEYVADLPED